MRPLTRLALAALCLMSAGLATAASFDCAKAGNATEKAICADPGLSRQDEALAALYQRQLEMPDTGQWAAFLRRDQRDWIVGRNSECRGDTECLKKDYQRRITYLGHPLLSWTGRYVEGRCPKDGRFLDVTPGDGGALDIELYICPNPRGNMLLQARDVLDAQRRCEGAARRALHPHVPVCRRPDHGHRRTRMPILSERRLRARPAPLTVRAGVIYFL